MHTPSVAGLYRLPYSKNDNPNGWVEITTDCNLKCPGCYRGCNRDDNVPVHEPLEAVRENIDRMKELRNCQIISLSGGEPLLHPDLKAIIEHIRAVGLHPFVHTNGRLLTPELIRELKAAGLAGLIIRVDSLSISRAKTESELNSVRKQHGEMIAAVRGIHLTFLCVVNSENIDELPEVIDWCIENAHLVDFITFIPMRQVRFTAGDILDDSQWITVDDLCRVVAGHIPDVRYASYLGSKLQNAKIQWLQAPWVVLNGRIIGYTGPKFVELFQMLHHLFKGTYAYKFGKDRSRLNVLTVLLLSLFLPSMRPVAGNYIRVILRSPLTLFKRATVQLLCYIVPPDDVDGKRDECDGCPDAMLYKGRLYPSCSLEQIKTLELAENPWR
jgi:pyruvate-formate lyase-activating enzyme